MSQVNTITLTPNSYYCNHDSDGSLILVKYLVNQTHGLIDGELIEPNIIGRCGLLYLGFSDLIKCKIKPSSLQFAGISHYTTTVIYYNYKWHHQEYQSCSGSDYNSYCNLRLRSKKKPKRTNVSSYQRLPYFYYPFVMCTFTCWSSCACHRFNLSLFQPSAYNLHIGDINAQCPSLAHCLLRVSERMCLSVWAHLFLQQQQRKRETKWKNGVYQQNCFHI